MRYALFAVLACSILGSISTACGPSTTWTRRAPVAASRSSDCVFEVHSTRPPRDYVVLGVFDLSAFSVKALPKTDAELQKALSKDVCRVGADALLPGVNGDGRYVLATAIKYVDGPDAFVQRGAP